MTGHPTVMPAVLAEAYQRAWVLPLTRVKRRTQCASRRAAPEWSGDVRCGTHRIGDGRPGSSATSETDQSVAQHWQAQGHEFRGLAAADRHYYVLLPVIHVGHGRRRRQPVKLDLPDKLA